MVNKIILNDVHLSIYNYRQTVLKTSSGMDLHQVSFAFLVKSEYYHDISVLFMKRRLM